MWRIVSKIWVSVHLLLLSVEDIKEQQLFMPAILELGLSGWIYALNTNHTPALTPGLFLLIVGHLTKEQIGYGDAFLVLALGMWMTDIQILLILIVGMIFSIVFAVCFRKKELPFVPFLTAAYLTLG